MPLITAVKAVGLNPGRLRTDVYDWRRIPLMHGLRRRERGALDDRFVDPVNGCRPSVDVIAWSEGPCATRRFRPTSCWHGQISCQTMLGLCLI
jgi:hypothetical protein